MTGLNVDEAETGEELSDEREQFVWNVGALGAPDEKSRFLEPDRVWILVGEVSEVVQRAADNVQRDAELLGLFTCWPVEVLEQELSDGEGLHRTLVGCIKFPFAFHPCTFSYSERIASASLWRVILAS